MRIFSSGLGQFLCLDPVFFKFLLGQEVWFHSSWNIIKQAQYSIPALNTEGFLSTHYNYNCFLWYNCQVFVEHPSFETVLFFVIRLGIIYLQDILIWTERFYRGSVPNRAKKQDFVHFPLTNVYFGKTIRLEHFQTFLVFCLIKCSTKLTFCVRQQQLCCE